MKKILNWLLKLIRNKDSVIISPDGGIISANPQPTPEVQLPLPVDVPPDEHVEIANFKWVDSSHHHQDFNVSKYDAKLFVNKCTQGTGMVDKTYAERKAACKAKGIYFGGYHFWEAGVDWKKQFDHYVKTHGEFTIPPILDFEAAGGNTAGELKADVENAYLWLIEAKKLSGKTPILYIGYALAKELKLPLKFKEFLPWIPRYNSVLGEVPFPWKQEDMFSWQFTESGHFNGFTGGNDVNIYYGKNNRLNLK